MLFMLFHDLTDRRLSSLFFKMFHESADRRAPSITAPLVAPSTGGKEYCRHRDALQYILWKPEVFRS